MEEKNCEILFEYLRDIIYDSENAKLDLEQLDEPPNTHCRSRSLGWASDRKSTRLNSSHP